MLESELHIENLKANPDAIASYLSEVFEKNDHAAVVEALQRVLRAQNVQAIARSSGMRRENLYKTFDGEVDPRLSRVMALVSALGLSFTVKALPPHTPPSSTDILPSEVSNAGGTNGLRTRADKVIE